MNNPDFYTDYDAECGSAKRYLHISNLRRQLAARSQSQLVSVMKRQGEGDHYLNGDGRRISNSQTNISLC